MGGGYYASDIDVGQSVGEVVEVHVDAVARHLALDACLVGPAREETTI